MLNCLDLAEGVALRYRDRGIDLDDLVQVARMGLIKAASRYRAGVGESFAAYAVPTISGEVKRHFRDFGWVVRPPRRLQERGARIVAEVERLQQENGAMPTRDELADALDLAPDDVAEAQESQTGFAPASLDAPTPQETTLGERVEEPSDSFAAVDQRDALRSALDDLDARQQKIVRLRFVEGWTQARIGEELGVTQMQVSRLLAGIVARLGARLQEADAEAEAPTPDGEPWSPGRLTHHVTDRPTSPAPHPSPRPAHDGPPRIGCILQTDTDPDTLVAQARRAERAGFDHLVIEDSGRCLAARSCRIRELVDAIASATTLPVTTSLTCVAPRGADDTAVVARLAGRAAAVLHGPLSLDVVARPSGRTDGSEGHDARVARLEEAVARVREEVSAQTLEGERSDPPRGRPGRSELLVVTRDQESFEIAARAADGISSRTGNPREAARFRRLRGSRATAVAEFPSAWRTRPESGGSGRGIPDRGATLTSEDYVAGIRRCAAAGYDLVHLGAGNGEATEMIDFLGEHVLPRVAS